MSVEPTFPLMGHRPIFMGVVERAFLLPSSQDGAAVRLNDGRVVQAWAQARHGAGTRVEVCHVGGDEWGVLQAVESAA